MKVPGFLGFHLLKGPVRADHQLYATHTVWQSYAAFEAWTRSEAFRKAHVAADDRCPPTVGSPGFEGYHVVQEVKADGQKMLQTDE
jgi:heme-degrading monooxygenase HmoA